MKYGELVNHAFGKVGRKKTAGMMFCPECVFFTLPCLRAALCHGGQPGISPAGEFVQLRVWQLGEAQRSKMIISPDSRL
jgi:hypothetical protein